MFQRNTCITVPHKTGIRLIGVAQNPANGFPARLLGSSLPEPQSPLAQALLLGQRGQIPSEQVEDFRSTGTSHLLAISGLHVGSLLVLCLGSAGWLLGRQRQIYLLAPLAAIWFYALISGLSPSVARAAIMGSIFLAALALGRPRMHFTGPGLRRGVNDSRGSSGLWTQVSFQLSFTALAGIILALPYQAAIGEKITGGPDPEGSWPRLWVTIHRRLDRRRLDGVPGRYFSNPAPGRRSTFTAYPCLACR